MSNLPRLPLRQLLVHRVEGERVHQAPLLPVLLHLLEDMEDMMGFVDMMDIVGMVDMVDLKDMLDVPLVLWYLLTEEGDEVSWRGRDRGDSHCENQCGSPELSHPEQGGDRFISTIKFSERKVSTLVYNWR